jgi:hypothetical protein
LVAIKIDGIVHTHEFWIAMLQVNAIELRINAALESFGAVTRAFAAIPAVVKAPDIVEFGVAETIP